jgi:predicted metalloprotease
VRFRKDASLDTGQVQDRRGSGSGGLAGLGGLGGLGGGGLNGKTIGGGAGAIVVLVVIVAFALLGGGAGQESLSLGTNSSGQFSQGDNTSLSQSCQTGEDANQKDDCRIVAVVNSVQDYWSGAIENYRPADTVFFGGQVSTGCGRASSAVGPFYCPADKQAYIDLGFYDELRQRFGANGGPFAEAYVIAHEYGHHVQELLGTNRQVGRDTGPTSGQVRLELQADCYAGVWASNAVDGGLIEELTPGDIQDGLNAASVIGDDRIQESTTGQVNPESWTHGSSEQRQRWFSIGYQSGDPNACDTFVAAAL